MIIKRQKTFGVKSKALGLLAPGSYQAKEAAKYGYDEDEYKKKRAGYALKGLFAPGTSTYMKKKAQEMHEEGKSQKEIRNFLENKGKHKSSGRVAAGVAEALTGSAGGVGHTIAQGVGIYDKVTGHRVKYKKKNASPKK
ncbi:MAG: hypothetical protein J6I84_04680 [Bacilli bacterium]|nr:hypothetical protein [Bacilli bacterium]